MYCKFCCQERDEIDYTINHKSLRLKTNVVQILSWSVSHSYDCIHAAACEIPVHNMCMARYNSKKRWLQVYSIIPASKTDFTLASSFNTTLNFKCTVMQMLSK